MTTTRGERVGKAAPSAEIGSSGLATYGGRVRDELHRKLQGDRAVKTFREMTDNDPTIGALLFGIETTLRKVGWRMEPNEHAEELGLEDEAQELADWFESALNDMSAPWDQTVSGILSFLPFGWSFLELVYKKREGESSDGRFRSAYDDGLWGWRKWALRAQESLARWEFADDGSIEAFVQQQASGGVPVPIPIERGLLFRTTSARGNPEGRSILRNAYRPWYFKKRIEEVEGVGVERDLAGLPVAGVPPEYLDEHATAEQKAVLDHVKRVVRDIKRDEQEGVIWPLEYDEEGHELWKLSLLSTGGRRQFDTGAIVARYDQRIAMTVLADFILLGQTSVGSRALADPKIELFQAALEAYADEICAVANTYAIPRLARFNGFDMRILPSLGYETLEKPDLEAIGKFLDSLTGGGVVIDRPLEEYLREKAGFPPPEDHPEDGAVDRTIRRDPAPDDAG